MEIEKLTPEGLKVAESYLKNGQDSMLVAQELQLPIEEVDRLLEKRETKAFIDRLYHESGFRNRHRMGELMDAIINQKLEEMDETGLGSQKDIVEILQLAHKMKMEQMEMELKLQKQDNPAVQINTQINNSGGERYNALLDKIYGVNNEDIEGGRKGG